MPLRNRVTPIGEIVALPGRGSMMGNRGVIHNERREIVREWQVRRWITCVLEFRGRHREVMQPNRWTELFFLDEATAFAAGHRPCAECRRTDYNRFRELWIAVNGGSPRADDIDLELHAQRLDGRKKRIYHADAGALPDGTYIRLDGEVWVVRGERAYRWSDAGYDRVRERPAGEVEVLTPRTIVDVFAAGYVPALHASAS